MLKNGRCKQQKERQVKESQQIETDTMHRREEKPEDGDRLIGAGRNTTARPQQARKGDMSIRTKRVCQV
jgi:hypothetical protein